MKNHTILGERDGRHMSNFPYPFKRTWSNSPIAQGGSGTEHVVDCRFHTRPMD